MSLPNTTSLLASFATLKALSDEKKYTNTYQILSEFIYYIIGTKKLYSFSAVEMKNELGLIFGFDVPEAVVKTSCKSIKSVTRENGIYTVEHSTFSFDPSFEKAKKDAENTQASIIVPLVKYIQAKDPKRNVAPDNVTQALIAFLVGDQHNGFAQYSDAIGEFILKNEDNAHIQEALSAIQEGSIWYIGINHNINETGSITKALTFYLGTEVLFSLAGYNGEIHKQLADDFLAQVKNANQSTEKVRLRYFSRTKDEIDAFFGSASLIAEGKARVNPTVAMNSILNSCLTASDVAVKQADFYSFLRYSLGIVEDEKKEYYTPDDEAYNLESRDIENKEDQESWIFVSHINKLRKGKITANNIDAEFIYITNAKNTLKISDLQAQKAKGACKLERVNDYAISLDKATNLLWYKLGSGFGRKSYPSSINAVIKAKVVLASTISHSVAEVYSKTSEQYKNGEISKDQLAARIITLYKKPILPEELDGDSIEDCLNFSAEFLSRYEEEVRLNRLALKQKDEQLSAKDRLLEEQVNQQAVEAKRFAEEKAKQLQERDETIKQKSQRIDEVEAERNTLTVQLEEYRQREESRKKDIEKRKCIAFFVLSILWKVAAIAIIAGFILYCETKFDNSVITYSLTAVEIVSLLTAVWAIFKKDLRKYFPKETAEAQK